MSPTFSSVDSGRWDPDYPQEWVESIGKIRGGVQGEIPSGIEGLEVEPGDHVLVVSSESAFRFVRHMIESFVLAGLTDRRFTEVCSLEVDPRIDAQEAKEILQEQVGSSLMSQVDVLGWSETGEHFPDYADLNESVFREEDLETFILSPAHQARARLPMQPRPLLRIASQDSGRYLACLRNPGDYVSYESHLISTLERSLGCPIVQLCAYEFEDLVIAGTRSRWTRTSTIRFALKLVRSHNKQILITSAGAITGFRAKMHIIFQLAIRVL